MAVKYLVINHLKFSYEGLFDPGELYNLISGFFYEKKWDWYEKINEEQITPDGKQVRLLLEPWKNITDYYKIQVKIKVNLIDLKEMEVEVEGRSLKMHHGLIRITFDAYVITDRKSLWNDKPLYWLIGILGTRYFYKDHFAKAETWVKSDVDDLYHKIKTYLNTLKYTYHA